MKAFYEPTAEHLARLSEPWSCSWSRGKDSTSLVTWCEYLRRAGFIDAPKPRMVNSDTGVEDTLLVGTGDALVNLLEKSGWEVGGDIRTFHMVPGIVSGVFGGPPCQEFSSLAHLVRANGHEPKFGNVIPEFERCVLEAAPAWFLMENVPAAPEPVVAGYGVKSFLLDNSMLDSGDGWGEEQRRVRRFSFVLPDAEPTVCRDQSALAEMHKVPDSVARPNRTRRQAVVSDPSAVPVKIGGSGKVKKTVRASPVTAMHEGAVAVASRIFKGKRRSRDRELHNWSLKKEDPFRTLGGAKRISHGKESSCWSRLLGRSVSPQGQSWHRRRPIPASRGKIASMRPCSDSVPGP